MSDRHSPGAPVRLPEREVATVFYVSLVFHVGCVGYAHETFAQFGDDLAVRRAAVETDLTNVRDIFATFIPRSTRGLPPTARVKRAVRMAMMGRALGKAQFLPGGRAMLFTITATTGGIDASQVAVLDVANDRPVDSISARMDASDSPKQ